MKMTDEHDIDKLTAPFFEAARRQDSTLPEGLTARIVADAARVQAEWQEAAYRTPSRTTFWQQFMAILGGIPALGGLAAACAAGIWLGASPPQGLDPLALVTGGLSDMTVYSATYAQDTLLSEDGL